jgi:hypothetical protein
VAIKLSDQRAKTENRKQTKPCHNTKPPQKDICLAFLTAPSTWTKREALLSHIYEIKEK